MNNLILFSRSPDNLSVSTNEKCKEICEVALAKAAVIGKCENAKDNQRVVEAQTSLKEYLDLIEHSRKFVKQAPWDLCVKIDTLANQLKKEATEEMMRISKLAGDYQAAERDRVRELERTRQRDLEAAFRDKHEQLLKATMPEEVEFIESKYKRQVESLPVAEPVKAENQTTKEDWEILITDIWLLAKMHPQCVNPPTERKLEIKALLKAGVTVAGIIATPVVKASVRLDKTKTIDV